MIIHIASAGTLLVDPPHWHLQMQWPKHHRVQHLMCQCLKKSIPGTEPSSSDYSPTEDDIYRMTAKTARMMENIQWMAEKIQCQTKNIWYPMHN
ncbi:hypothetical protein CgunFtcFv8_002172 [Champsocephalus gunnari]|uniref:Uncharacterized protein n=1 Tax=Champsocephalus gunnari TaxID=52237 RepID=A0AAN8CMG0_CHAGU|nr:hypothetical protein CgunFtcFv8_002172 [Champsocephalus gunnari]